MALHKLSTRSIHTATPGDIADGGGLFLRVTETGSSWVFRFTAPDGRRREMGLGRAMRQTLIEAGRSVILARSLAEKARALVAAGRDPIEQRNSEREAAKAQTAAKKEAAKRESTTLARAARAYHERVIEPTRTEKHAAQWIASLEQHVPDHLWHSPIEAISPPALLEGLTGVRALADTALKVPETLQRIRQRLDAVFEDAVFHGHCASNSAAAIKRKLQETIGKRTRGQLAALPYREAPEFMRRLREQHGFAARCLELSVLTVARTSESIAAAPQEFDLSTSTWVVPGERMKGREVHTVHLVARAMEIVETHIANHPLFLFPSPTVEGQPLSNMAMLAVLDRMGMRGSTTVHGLCRATFSTWANETAAARPDVIEACLAHQEGNKIRAAYNRAQFMAERRALLEAWAAYLSPAPVSTVGTTERLAS